MKSQLLIFIKNHRYGAGAGESAPEALGVNATRASGQMFYLAVDGQCTFNIAKGESS
jgi:hypothetical protein